MAVQTLISQLGFGMFIVVWQPYILHRGMSIIGLGVIQSVMNLSTAAGLIIWGVLSDRYGRKPVILVSYACRMLAMAALIISGDFIFLVAFAFLIGFSSLFRGKNPARSAMIAESASSGNMATAYSTLRSITAITNTVMASAGGYIAVTSGYTPILYVSLAGDAVGLLLLTLLLKETLDPTLAEDTSKSPMEGLGDLFIPEAGMGRLYLISLVIGLGYGIGYSLFYGTLVDNYGFTIVQLGQLSTVHALTLGLASVPVGKISDRFGSKLMLLTSCAMALISVVGFLVFRSFGAFLFFQVARALDPTFWSPAWMTLLAKRVPRSKLSTVMGKIAAIAKICGIPAPWLGGVIYTHYGFKAPLLVVLVSLTILIVLVLSIREVGASGSI